MADYFFITGHPRSRTAWLSNLFTTGRVVCVHDATRMVKKLPHLDEVLSEARYDADYIGASCNGLPLFPECLESFLEGQDRLPIAIIERPVDEVRESLYRFTPEVPKKATDRLLEKSYEGLAKIKLLPHVLVLPYSALNSPAALDVLWNHLIPTIPFDMQRANLLRGLNTQIQQPWYNKGFSEDFVGELLKLTEDKI